MCDDGCLLRHFLDVEDVFEIDPGRAKHRAETQDKLNTAEHVCLVKEVGNHELDEKVAQALKRNKILAIGPNCLGTFDAYTKMDSLFLPRYRLQRPKEGGISFVCQSGAVGSAILDFATD